MRLHPNMQILVDLNNDVRYEEILWGQCFSRR